MFLSLTQRQLLSKNQKQIFELMYSFQSPKDFWMDVFSFLFFDIIFEVGLSILKIGFALNNVNIKVELLCVTKGKYSC